MRYLPIPMHFQYLLLRRFPILIAPVFLIIMICGGCSHPSREGTPVKYEQGLTEQAWLMADTGASFDEYFAVQQEAVRLMRAGMSHEDPVAVLEQMAYFLFSAGRLDEAFPYFNEAVDSLHAIPGRQESECVIQLYGDLSQFYERLGMPGKAIEYSDSAMAVSRRLGGVLMGDLWRFRTQIYANNGNTNEAFRCFDMAYDAIRNCREPIDTTLQLAVIDAERANLILSRDPSRDSVDLAVSLLRNISAVDEYHDFTGYDATLGYGLYLQGNKEAGIGMMKSAVDKLRELGDLEMSFLEMRRLIEVYNREKMFDEVSSLYNEYNLLSDSMSRARHNLDLMIAKVRTDVAAKDRENRMLHEKLQDKNHQNLVIVAASVFFAIIAALIIIVSRRYSLKMKQRRDAERARRISAEAYISEAHNERDTALERIETIKREISGQIAASTDILYRPQTLGSNSGQFMRAFNAMYPRYAEDLRRDYPSLTDTDMILCMLIYLKHTTEEISCYLNISRASVNSARYRIRTKVKLTKEDDLNNFLRTREG